VNPDIKAQQQRLLERGKEKMSTFGAAMRRLIHICFDVLKSQDDYRFPIA
jgi:transposase